MYTRLVWMRKTNRNDTRPHTLTITLVMRRTRRRWDDERMVYCVWCVWSKAQKVFNYTVQQQQTMCEVCAYDVPTKHTHFTQIWTEHHKHSHTYTYGRIQVLSWAELSRVGNCTVTGVSITAHTHIYRYIIHCSVSSTHGERVNGMLKVRSSELCI